MTHVLVVGGGGREHALAWKLAQSSRVTQLTVAPGNAGTAALPRTRNVDIDATDVVSLLDYAESANVDMTVIGPEEPLARGLADQFAAVGLRVFGPLRRAALVETSKSHAKELMRRWGVPTAPYEVFTELDAAMEYVMTHPVRELVIKADGLARGKGVFLPLGEADAEGILRALLERNALGHAGRRVLIEQRLHGPEVSVAAFCDGQHLAPIPAACDYKRLRDGGEGPNTGGMGGYAPALKEDEQRALTETVLAPMVAGLAEAGTPFRGVLCAGVMLTEAGPQVLELNVRFGDPAAQLVLPLLETDLLDVIEACVEGTLDALTLQWRRGAAVAVELVTAGYPARSDPNLPIAIDVPPSDDVLIFHAGTRRRADGTLVTWGGRVLTLTALGPNLRTAIKRAYGAVGRVRFAGMHYRTDIGARGLE